MSYRVSIILCAAIWLGLQIPAISKDIQPSQNINSVKGVTVSAQTTKGDQSALDYQLIYPVIKGAPNRSVQKKLNSLFKNEALRFNKKMIKTAKEDQESAKKDNYPFRKYQAFTAPDLKYNDGRILSLTRDFYEYTGGAHGNTLRTPTNIDLKTGKPIKLKNLFKADTNYRDLLLKEMKQQIKGHEQEYFAEEIKPFEKDPLFFLEKGNIVIYFSQYEIAPYASGMPEFRISVEKYKEHLTPNAQKL